MLRWFWVVNPSLLKVRSKELEVLHSVQILLLAKSLALNILISATLQYSSCCGELPTLKLLSLLFYSWYFATVVNHSVNLRYFFFF